MKKLLFVLAVLFLGFNQVTAQEIFVEDFSAPEGGIQKFDVKYKDLGGKTFVGYIFKVVLPEGLSFVTDDDDLPVYEFGEGNDKFNINRTEDGGFQASASSLTAKLSGDEGTLVTLKVKVDDSLAEGDEVKIKVDIPSLTEKDGDTYIDHDSDPFEVIVTIADSRLVFDEAKAAPEFTAGQNYDVKIVRTVKAGNWSTIVLPCPVSADEYKAVFGNDVKLARLTGLNVVYKEGTKEIKNLDLLFNTHTGAMTAGRPYLILTQQEKDGAYEFTLDAKKLQAIKTDQKGVFSEEDEDTGDELTITALFAATYEGATIPANGIFLNSNKFYTSVGKTKTKGLRGWFDVDAAVGQDMSGAKIGFFVDGEATSVDGIPSYQRVVEGVYDLSGRKIKLENGDVTKLQKGVYIIDGKKVTIK